MKKALFAGVILLSAGAVLAVPITDGPKVMSGMGPITEARLLEFLGHTPETVTLISYTPDPVERVVSWEEFRAALGMTSFGQSMETDNHARLWIGGTDSGNGVVNALPFCDNSSVWTIYGKDFAPDAGASYTKAEVVGSTNLVTCGGFYGPTQIWDLQVSIYPVALGMAPRLNALSMDGCYATIWTDHPDGYCPLPSTPLDTFGFWNAEGAGVKTTADFGTAWMDYFLGNGAAVSYSTV